MITGYLDLDKNIVGLVDRKVLVIKSKNMANAKLFGFSIVNSVMRENNDTVFYYHTDSYRIDGFLFVKHNDHENQSPKIENLNDRIYYFDKFNKVLFHGDKNIMLVEIKNKKDLNRFNKLMNIVKECPLLEQLYFIVCVNDKLSCDVEDVYATIDINEECECKIVSEPIIYKYILKDCNNEKIGGEYYLLLRNNSLYTLIKEFR